MTLPGLFSLFFSLERNQWTSQKFFSPRTDKKKIFCHIFSSLFCPFYFSFRPMIASSPSNGNETKENPISENPQYEFMGDVHYYNYDDDCWDESIFPRPRFASEYGYQSFPSFLTLRDVSIESDWFWDSPFMMHRQHHEDGNDQIMAQLKRHYLLPDHQSDSVLNFSDTLLMVQVVYFFSSFAFSL